MNNFYQENKRSAILLLILLFILVLVFFFLFIQPLRTDLVNEENQIKTAEMTIDTLRSTIAQAGTNGEEADMERYRYTNEIPTEPEIDNIILTLEEIAFVSQSRIENVEFSYDGRFPEREEDGDFQEEDFSDLGLEELEEDVEEETEDQFTLEEVPEKLQLIIATVDIYSPDYDHFLSLLQEIENEERIMGVSRMNFVKPGESDLVVEENPDETIEATMDIMTFYYEEE